MSVSRCTLSQLKKKNIKLIYNTDIWMLRSRIMWLNDKRLRSFGGQIDISKAKLGSLRGK